MPWEQDQNYRSLSPFGLKEAQGFAQRSLTDANCVPCPEMPPGILGMTPINTDPHGSVATPKGRP
jgi:hypothetical protein